MLQTYVDKFDFKFRTQPLTDDNRTVLVVGGVHWLASQHLDLIIKALKRYHIFILALKNTYHGIIKEECACT